MFLAHFLSTNYETVLKWGCRKIAFRFEQAQTLHHKLNPFKSEDKT